MTKKVDIKQLEDRISSLEAQLKRAVADYQNLEKRVSEGRSELTRWGTSELIIKLLPTLDHLEQALSGTNENDRQSGWFKGVEMAVKEFKQALQSEGLEEIQVDGQFDPSTQEAVDTKVGEDNKILEVVRNGYILNGKVLRPARVMVGKRHSGDAIGRRGDLQHDEIKEGEN